MNYSCGRKRISFSTCEGLERQKGSIVEHIG